MRRLESESVRDAMLAASGMVSYRMHGPPVPVKEDAVGEIVLGKEMLDGERKPTGSESLFDGMGRRSVYVQVRRSRPLNLAWRVCFSQAPESDTVKTLRSFVDRQSSVFLAQDNNLSIESARRMALASACQAMLSSNQFIYID